jgi:ABC-type transport system substrate-binding protein
LFHVVDQNEDGGLEQRRGDPLPPLLVIPGLGRHLDPVTQDANPDIWAFMQIYQQLVRVNVKGDGFEPDLAEKWSTSADGRTWTFLMRKNARFSNGDPSRPATRSGP